MTRLSKRLESFPRPNRTTLQLMLLAVAAGAASWFIVIAPQQHRAIGINAELDRTHSRLAEANTTLDAYRRGDVRKGPELTAAVRPVESLLPAATTSAGAPLAALEAAARARGLIVEDVNVATEYSTPENQKAYPNLAVAAGTITVSGSIPAFLAFLDSLDSFPQLVTYSTSGYSAQQGNSLQVKILLWASTDPSWQNGRPSDSRTPASTTTVPSTTTLPVSTTTRTATGTKVPGTKSTGVAGATGTTSTTKTASSTTSTPPSR